MGMTTKEAIEAIKCNWPDSRYTILREALDMAISALRDQDAADVAPVRNGRWEKVAWWQHQNRYECNECSLCGCRVKPKFTYNYCPHCGAKMDLPDECKQEVER